jgi:GntR family transcriptional regulator
MHGIDHAVQTRWYGPAQYCVNDHVNERPSSHPASSPAYLSIAAELRDRIEAGELAPGALIPSEREMSGSFGVSRMTARSALAVLEHEGYVARRPPRGTFVAEPRIPMRIGSFSDEIVRRGRRPGAELLWVERQEPTPLVAQALDLPAGAFVHALQRLRRVDDEPLAIETTYFPEDRTPGLLDLPLGGSLWELLREHHGIQATRAEATLEVVALDDNASRRLGVRAAASGILLIRRTYDQDGRCFEYARDLYRADRTAFQMEADLPAPPAPAG